MGGRVKYRPGARPGQRRDLTQLVERQANATLFDSTTSGAQPFKLDKQTIAWLVILSVIVVTAMVVVGWLLCRCQCRKRRIKRYSNGHRYHPSLEMNDDRNGFDSWNRNAPPRMGTDEGGPVLEPLNRAFVQPAGFAHPGEPVIVEEEPLSSVSSAHTRKTGSKYFSGMSSAWRRVSQIGRAY